MKMGFPRFSQYRVVQYFIRAVDLFQIFRVTAIIYGLLTGFLTLTEYDLGWQLATAQRIVQIPSTDVFSYTAFEHPWIYQVGASLIFYGLYLIGKYQLLS